MTGADQNQSPGPAARLLDPVSYTSFGLTITASEIVIVLGQSRIGIALGQAGPEATAVLTDFTTAASLPPNVALALAEALKKAVETYENTFGTIPVDPKASMILQNPMAKSE